MHFILLWECKQFFLFWCEHSKIKQNKIKINFRSRSGESRPFVLMTTFPNKELTEESQTLQEAGLLNAVVVQKYK